MQGRSGTFLREQHTGSRGPYGVNRKPLFIRKHKANTTKAAGVHAGQIGNLY